MLLTVEGETGVRPRPVTVAVLPAWEVRAGAVRVAEDREAAEAVAVAGGKNH